MREFSLLAFRNWCTCTIFNDLFQGLGSNISNLRPVHEKFKSICEKVLSEGERDIAPLKMQISEIEALWNNMIQHFEIKSQQLAVIEKPSCAFFNKEAAFVEFLTDAEAKMDALNKVPSTLKDAEKQTMEVKVCVWYCDLD